MRSKQRVNDSFRVFLRNVRKKTDSRIAGTRSHNDPGEIPKFLNQTDSASIDELSKESHESTYNIFKMVNETANSDLVRIEPDTDTVSLTDTGRSVMKAQDFFAN